MSIQIVTDSTAYLTKTEIAHYGIKVVQLPVQFEGVEQDEGFPGEFVAFFNRLKTAKTFPTTSQPSPHAYLDVFEEATVHGKEVIVLTVSSKVSGTHNAALIAAEMGDVDKISVIDSGTGVATLKHLVIDAQRRAEAGESRETIVAAIEQQKQRTGLYFTVETLENLKRSGRLSTAQAFVGGLLNVKPIIQLKASGLEVIERVRGKKRAIQSLIRKIPRNVKKIYIPHVLNDDEARSMEQTVKRRFPHVDVELTVLGPVIGSHLGIGAIGVCFVW